MQRRMGEVAAWCGLVERRLSATAAEADEQSLEGERSGVASLLVAWQASAPSSALLALPTNALARNERECDDQSRVDERALKSTKRG